MKAVTAEISVPRATSGASWWDRGRGGEAPDDLVGGGGQQGRNARRRRTRWLPAIQAEEEGDDDRRGAARGAGEDRGEDLGEADRRGDGPGPSGVESPAADESLDRQDQQAPISVPVRRDRRDVLGQCEAELPGEETPRARDGERHRAARQVVRRRRVAEAAQQLLHPAEEDQQDRRGRPPPG